MSSEKIRQFVFLAAQTEQIASDSRLTGEQKYNKIFSPSISGRLSRTGLMPSYYDPDSSYEEDVAAFVAAVKAQAETLVEEYNLAGDSGLSSAVTNYLKDNQAALLNDLGSWRIYAVKEVTNNVFEIDANRLMFAGTLMELEDWCKTHSRSF